MKTFEGLINYLFNKNIILLLILIIGLITFRKLFKKIDGFDNLNLNPSSSNLSKPIPEQYQYLAPLPEGSVWTPEFQDKYISFLQKTNPSAKKDDLSNPNPFLGGKSLMEVASQKEAQYQLDNGIFPYDEYVTNFMLNEYTPAQTATQLETIRKMFPNRAAYNFIQYQSVPQLKILGDIQNSQENKLPNGKSWKCLNESTFQTKEDDSSSFINSTDYSFLPNNIPDFSFEGDPCNVCSILKLQPTYGGSPIKAYNSPENQCKFKMNGEIPEAYNVFIGKYGTAKSESNPSETDAKSSGDEYQKCITSCEKYK